MSGDKQQRALGRLRRTDVSDDAGGQRRRRRGGLGSLGQGGRRDRRCMVPVLVLVEARWEYTAAEL